MGSRSAALEARLRLRATRLDHARLDQAFPAVGFEPLDPHESAGACARMEEFVGPCSPFASDPLDHASARVGEFGIDPGHRLAIRLPPSESGTWFAVSDSTALLGALEREAPRVLELYDRDADRLYVVHAAEYAWEYYRVG